jgi:hypothetical protein
MAYKATTVLPADVCAETCKIHEEKKYNDRILHQNRSIITSSIVVRIPNREKFPR